MTNEYLKAFKHHLTYVEGARDNTIKAYLSDLNNYVAYLTEQELSCLTATHQDIETFLLSIHDYYQKSTINRMVSALNAFYSYIEVHYKIQNPMILLDYKHHQTPLPKTLYVDDIKRLVDTFSTSERDLFHLLIVYLLLGSGLRVSELTSLTFSNYYQNEGMLNVVGKGNKMRWIPVYDKAKVLLDDYLIKSQNYRTHASKNYLLIRKNGKPLTRQYVYTMIKKQGNLALIKEYLTQHRIRQGFATLLLEQGSELRVVQELLGHASISTTQINTHLQPGQLHKSYDDFHPGAKIAMDIKDDEDEI